MQIPDVLPGGYVPRRSWPRAPGSYGETGRWLRGDLFDTNWMGRIILTAQVKRPATDEHPETEQR
ncbi:MAG: hypothetical protein ACOC5M_03140 [Chloroflexota bacterium]